MKNSRHRTMLSSRTKGNRQCHFHWGKDSEPVCYPAMMAKDRLNPEEAGRVSYLASRSSASLLLHGASDSFSQARSLICYRPSNFTSMLEFLIVLNYRQPQPLAIVYVSEITADLDDKTMCPSLTHWFCLIWSINTKNTLVLKVHPWQLFKDSGRNLYNPLIILDPRHCNVYDRRQDFIYALF